MYISVGSLETNEMVPNVYVMYERLKGRKYPGLEVKLDILDGEAHVLGIGTAVTRGLKSVFASEVASTH